MSTGAMIFVLCLGVALYGVIGMLLSVFLAPFIDFDSEVFGFIIFWPLLLVIKGIISTVKIIGRWLK